MSVQKSTSESTTKKFGSGQRVIPAAANAASKYYSASNQRQTKKVRKAQRPSTRRVLQPGTVLILLAGRFRGKRVVLLEQLDQGVLLVTGPFKVNGVPLRRVNYRFVIATSTKVDISALDKSVIEKASKPSYFTADKAAQKAGEEAFFKQGEKPEAKKISSERIEDQKTVDKAIIAGIKKEPFLAGLLSSTWSLRKGDRPHEMVF